MGEAEARHREADGHADKLLQQLETKGLEVKASEKTIAELRRKVTWYSSEADHKQAKLTEKDAQLRKLTMDYRETKGKLEDADVEANILRQNVAQLMIELKRAHKH